MPKKSYKQKCQTELFQKKGAQGYSRMLNQGNLQVHGSLLKFKHKPTINQLASNLKCSGLLIMPTVHNILHCSMKKQLQSIVIEEVKYRQSSHGSHIFSARKTRTQQLIIGLQQLIISFLAQSTLYFIFSSQNFAKTATDNWITAQQVMVI